MTAFRCRPDQHFCLFGPRFDVALEILRMSAHVVIWLSVETLLRSKAITTHNIMDEM